MADSTERIIRLGETDGFRYIGFKPPLNEDELSALPLPETHIYNDHLDWRPTSTETHTDGSMDVGFDATPFEIGDEDFETYARRVSEYLGKCSLDTTVRIIGPGSVIAQANGEPAQW